MKGSEAEPKQTGRNLGASFQQRLRNLARATGNDVSLLLTRYVNERFLYRLSASPYRNQFVLRGAALFSLWNSEPHRPTRDIDLLAAGDDSGEGHRRILVDVCNQRVEPDGVTFLLDTLQVEERGEGRIYRGLHIAMLTTLGTARPRIEIDIAFGEAVTPAPVEADLPVMLGMPAPRLRVYSMQTVVAEKCEALVSLGIPNTRMKDFYDLWYLSRRYAFNGTVLSRALQATFSRRNTRYPEGGAAEALTTAFSEDPIKQRQWAAFLGKSRFQQSAALPELIDSLRLFLGPPLRALAEGRPFDLLWTPEGFWQPPDEAVHDESAPASQSQALVSQSED